MQGFDTQAAMKAGYSAGEIADFLAKQRGFDVSAARSAGYADDEIVSFLADATPAAPDEPGFLDRVKSGAERMFAGDGMLTNGAIPEGSDLSAMSLPGMDQEATVQARESQRTATGSVMDGYAPAPKIEGMGSPVSDKTFEEVKRLWEGATEKGRASLEALPGPRGAVARTIAKQYTEMTPATEPLDERREARRMREIRKGTSPETADVMAATRADGGSVQASDFDFDTRERYKDASPVVRGAVKGAQNYKKGALGTLQALAELGGADYAAGQFQRGAERAEGVATAIGEGDAATRHFEGAVASIVQQLPGMLGGGIAGSTAIALGTMGVQSFGQEYADGRAAGLEGADAAKRAGLFTAFEIAGERFGVGNQLRAIRGAMDGVPTGQLVEELGKALAKEIPGESLTTTGQFLTDKAPSFGLNPEAGWSEYLGQMSDTVIQTVMQGGMMMGGTSAASAGVRGIDRLTQQRRGDLTDGMQFDPGQIDAVARQSLAPSNAQLLDTAPATQIVGPAPESVLSAGSVDEAIAAAEASAGTVVAPAPAQPVAQQVDPFALTRQQDALLAAFEREATLTPAAPQPITMPALQPSATNPYELAAQQSRERAAAQEAERLAEVRARILAAAEASRAHAGITLPTGAQQDGTGTFQRTDAALAAPGNPQAGLDLGRGPADTPRQPDGGQQPGVGAAVGTPVAGSGAAEPAGVARAGRAAVAPAATVSPTTGEMQPNETQRAEVAGEAAPPAGTQAAPAVEPIEVRAGRVIDDLRAMAQDAGWAEQGGKMVRDQDGNVSRTKWIPRAEWFMAGMESRPDVLAQHIEDFAAGKRIPIKSRRTIEGMTEWREAQGGVSVTPDPDASMYDFEASGAAEVQDSVESSNVFDVFDDAGPMTIEDEIAAMRSLGFTEEEIQNEIGRSQTAEGARRGGEDVARGAESNAEGATRPGGTQTQAGSEGSREGLTLDSYTRDDLAQREAQQQAAADLERRTEQQAAQRAEADARRADFTLTGSDRDADVAAARGQGGLFDQPAPDDGPRFSRGNLAADPESFIAAPDGSIDFGEITPDMAQAMRRQAGKIRLQRGWHDHVTNRGSGLVHIEERHGREIRAAGFESIEAFVFDAVQKIDAVWQPGATSQIVAVQTGGRGKVVFIELQRAVSDDVDYYRVNSAFPADQKYVDRKRRRENWKPLWSRYPVSAEASGATGFVDHTPNAGESAPTVSPQSDSSVAKTDDKNTSSFSRTSQSAAPRGLTESTLRATIAERIPSLSRAVDAMLRRGEKGQKGGLVVIASGNELDIAEVFASKTGRDIDDAVQMFSDADGINGFYDPRSGITFLVGPNVTAETAPAVLLHESIHGQQRQDIDADAVRLLGQSDHPLHPQKTREFLKRVQRRIDSAGETGNAQEAAAYIVEQATIEGRQEGFSAIDGRFMDWVDGTLGKRIGNFIRDFVAMIRTWALRHGAEARNLTVDDLVAIAKAGVQQAARGDVVTSGGQPAASMIGDAIVRALRGLAAMARSSGNENSTVRLGPIDERQAELLQREGVAVDSGFSHTADMFAVRHALKRHGDEKTEAKQGQLPVRDEDIAAIPVVIKSAEALILGARTPRGQDIIGSLKRMPDGTVLYLEEVRSGRKTLAMTSMRRYPGTTDFETIKNRVVPSYAQSDTGDVRIVRLDGSQGQEGDSPRFSRTGAAPFSAPKLPDSKISRNLDNIQYQLQDRFVDLKRVQEAIKENGVEIRDEFNPYMLETLMHGKAAYRVQRFMETEINPILTELRMAGIKMDRFEKYLHARHAVERNAEMAKRNPNQAELDKMIKDAADEVVAAQRTLAAAVQANVGVGVAKQNAIQAEAKLNAYKNIKPWSGTEAERQMLSGMSNSDALRILTAEHAGPQATVFKGLGKKIDEFTARTRQEMAGYGIESTQAVGAWDALYKHYVPLKRDMDESDLLGTTSGTGAGISIRGSMVKEATGSLREVENIFANLVAQREAAIVRGEKNVVGKALYGLALENPNSDMWTVIRPDMSESALRAELQRMGLDPDEVANFTKAPTTATIDERTGLVVHRVNPMYRNMSNAVVVRVGGEDRVVLLSRTNDRAVRLARALRNDDADIKSAFVKGMMQAFGPTTRYLAAVNTQYNPIFGVTNFARDIQGAMLNLTTTELNGKQLRILKSVMKNSKTPWWKFWNTKIGGDAIQGIWNWERGDKSHPWAVIYEEFLAAGGATGFRDQFANLEDRAKAIEREVGQTGFRNAKGIKQTLDLLSDYNTTLENAIRLATFKEARDAGISAAQAADMAKDITVNFNRKGARSAVFASLFPFFNSSVQGSERTLRVLRVSRKIISALVSLGVMNTMLMIWYLGDDWDALQEFERSRHLFIPAPWLGEKRYIKIPLALGFNAFTNIGRVITEMAWFRNKMGERTAGAITTTIDALFNPLGSGGLLDMAAPGAIDPFVQLNANKNSFGHEIFREDFSSLKPTPGFTRAKNGTNALWVAVAEAMNTVTGGDAEKQGWWSPEPERFSYLFGVATGGLGREVDKIVSTAQGVIEGTDVPAHRIPLLGRFYGEAGGNTVVSAKFYRAIIDVNVAEHSVIGKTKRDAQYSDEDAALAPLSKMFRRYQSAIASLRKEMDQTDDRDRKREIEAEIVELQRQAVEIVDEARAGVE